MIGTIQMISGPRGGRPTVESCRALDVRRVIRSGLACGLVIGDNGAPLAYRLDLGASRLYLGAASADLTATRCPYGGERWWVLCPGCQRRVAVLYGGAMGWRCRGCYALVYTSTRESNSERAIRKARKLRLRLGGSPSLFATMPERPRGMWARRYKQLRAAAVAAEERTLAGLRRCLDASAARLRHMGN